jgi:4-hydroxybenzoyl-CoA reductase subunit alpha
MAGLSLPLPASTPTSPRAGPSAGTARCSRASRSRSSSTRLAEDSASIPSSFAVATTSAPTHVTVNELRIGIQRLPRVPRAVERPALAERRRPAIRRGLGVAGSTYISGTNYPIYPNDMPQRRCRCRWTAAGASRVLGANEIGQGSDTMLAVIAADELGASLEDVRVVRADTDLHPRRSRRLLELADHLHGRQRRHRGRPQAPPEGAARRWPRRWEVRPSEVLLAGGGPSGPGPDRQMPIREAFNLAEAKFGLLGSVGSYNTPKDRARRLPRRHHRSLAGVLVHRARGRGRGRCRVGVVDVKKIWVAHDCGRALNPVIVEGQMEGSAYMGFAEAIMEEQMVKDAGHGRAACTRPSCSTTASPRASTRPSSRRSSSRRPTRRVRTAPRRRAKGRCIRRSRRSPTRSTTPSACAWTGCRSRPPRCSRPSKPGARPRLAASSHRTRSGGSLMLRLPQVRGR